MIPTAGLSDGTMIAAAERRAVVRLQRGNLAKLVGWKVRGGANRARVEVRPGVSITVRCDEVVAVEASDPVLEESSPPC